MPSPFTLEQRAALAAPHVARAWFVRLDLPAGEMRLHSGIGSVEIDGQEWRGVTDPISGVLVGAGQIEEPRFGAAAAVTLVLVGANLAFLQSVRAARREIEGRRADVYFACFDQETQTVIGGLVPLFAAGRMTSPAIEWQGIGRRIVTITIENIWSAQNFAPGNRWNDADHQRRHPGDRFFQWAGQKVQELWR